MAVAQDIRFPFPMMPAPKRRWLSGLVVSLFGHGLFYVGFACLAATLAAVFVLPATLLLDPQIFRTLIWMLVAVPGVVALPIGAQVVIYGRRMRARDALSVLSIDPRPPVLYLRSFDDEDLPDPTFRSPFHLENLPNPFIPQRYEERLVPVLRRIGPVISIGRPGERRAELGAARLYVRDDDWQAAVRYLAADAAALVIVVGRSHSLWWEIDLVLAHVRRERLLFFFPYVDESKARRRFWRKYYEIIPSVIPRSIGQRSEEERQARYRLFRERLEQKVSGRWPEELGGAQFLDFSDPESPRLLATKRPIEAICYSLIFRKSTAMWISARATLRPFVNKVRSLNTGERMAPMRP